MARQLARSSQGRFRRCFGSGLWLLVLMALAPLTAQAQLAPRHSFNVRGDVAMVGNALLTCATTGTGSANCANQRMSNSTGGNGNRVMEFINVDAAGLPASVPANSSAATLTLPAGARVRSAGLYWGSRAGNTDADRRTIQFRTPGGAYRSVTASAANLNTFNAQGDTDANRPYTAYADVTALVAASGSGTYYAGGLTAVAGNGGGLGNYGGWALIVLYEDSSKPFRRLMVFDGDAGYVSGGNAQSASVSGLLTPSSGPFDAFMGALVWEGDGDITGDAFQLSGNGNVLNPGAVSDALSPANNFWNSGITRLGERFTNKSPDYANQFAVDLKLVDISNNAANAASSRPRLANSATGATLTFTSTGDAYFPHALVFVTDLFVPDLVSSLDKTVRNVTHPTGPLRRGDILEYTVSFKNSGQDGATRTTVRDPIPTHTAFVPGSLRVVSDDGRGIAGNNAPETDGAGDDVAEFDAAGNRVVFRVGAGANATGGGLLTSGQGATLRFQVKVSDTAPDTAQIVNNAEVTHNGQTVEVADDYEGRASATIGPVEVPAIAAVNFCPADGGMFGIVNGAGFRRFVPGSGTDETVGDLAISLPGNLNGLMLDAARNRLLFHTRGNGSGGEVWAYDANNGGWYQTGAVIAADLPRAGMTRDGVGYMVTPVTGRTARMYRLDPAGAFGYTAGAPTTLTYDVAPSDTGSGDIAFDQDGMGWLVAGSDLYRVDVNAGTATLQQRFTGAPSGAFYAGAAFGADGKLYVVVNATGAYYAMDLATGTMTLVGTSSLTSGSDRGRDLASCSFPLIAPPQLQVNKVLSTVNGQTPGTSVAPGDVLEYEIRISHIAGSQAATLFAGDVVEGVPANTTFLPSGSDFTCAAALCSNSNAVNITAGGSATLRFRVQVATTIPGAATAIRNEVAVRGNTPVDCAATGNDCEETTPLTLTPGLTSTKALTLVNGAAPSGTVAVGDVLTYVVTATNTGNMVLPSVVVADARIVPATLTCADLAPAAECVLTGVYTVTQADLDSGVVRNTASITTPGTDGVCPVGNSTASCNPTLDTPVDPALPALTIVKTGSVPSASTVGGTMTYSFVVTNTGNVTLNAVAVVDDKLTVAPVCPVTTLAPGAATTCTGTYTLVQADLDAGRVVNRARAEGVPPATPGNPNPPRVPSPEDEAITDLPSAPALTIVKSAGLPSGTTVGSTIAYAFLVTNTGNVTLRDIAVVDAKLATAPVCPVTTLAPGATTTCTGTYTLVQADLDAGRVVNTARAEGTPPSTFSNPTPPRVPSPEDEETVDLPASPAMSIVKTAGQPSGTAVGSTIRYSFLVTNTGNVTLNDIVVVDDKLAAAPTCPLTTLVPGAATTCSGIYTLTQADVDAGRVVNAARAEGTPPATPGNPNPPRVPSPEDEETTDLPSDPSLSIVKTAGSPTGATVGSTIAYSFRVTNIGNVTLTEVAVIDVKLSTPPACPATTLAPGATVVCTGTYTLTQADLDAGQVLNSAHAEGAPPATPGNPTPPRVPSPEDEVITNLPSAPSLSIVKTGGTPSGGTAGSTIAYTFVVTNTGNVTLGDIRVVDAKLTAAPVCPVTTLAPGAVTTCTGAYTLTQGDLDAGRVVNRAHAEGVPPATPGNPNPPRVPSTEDEEIVDLPAAPSLSIEKTAGPASGNAVGSTIAYSFLVTNTGNVTLSALTVVDSKLATAPSCPVNTLPPGASTVCTGTYTLDQADLDAGEVVNTAHAEGTPPSTPGNPGSVPVKSPEDTVRTPVAQVPALESTKQLSRNADEDGSGSVTLNDTLTYTVTASNVGNTTLKDVVVTDSKITPASITCLTLAPAARCVLEGTYRVSQADVVAGNVRNVALIATATPGLCGTGTDNPACAPSLDIPVLAWEIDAEDDRDRTPQNTPVTTPVLQNDLLDGKAADPALVQVSEHMPPTNGSIVVNDDGTITYTPNPGFWGEDSYAYQICERGNPTNCTTARVVITIDPNRVEAIDDAGRTDPGVPLQLVVVGNDRSHGAPLDPESVLVMTPPSNGTVTCAAGICSYTPAAGFVGTDTYVYRVCDTSYPTALCAEATVTVEIEGTAALRLTKSTTSRDVKTGDLVRYSVTIENVGTVDLSGGSVLDTPPAGFTYVEGSLLASDGRSSVVVSGFNPVRFDGIDLKIGDQMTLVYLMRVGAGVQRGVQINRAQARDGTGQLASNVATAEVVLDADPLLDESLVFGTVFDDRDGDGWQDSAALTGLKVQGGFAADDYVAGSTLVDHGSGMTPVSDASAPLLRGLSLGRLSGRKSVADPADRHAVVIRQRLRKGTFTGDFVLENDQGMRVHMAADGTTRVEKRGDAAKGLTAAAPVVERRIVVEGDEMVVDYIIRNEGIDERGIPGVRLASVEGLLIETDQFGRYHLTGVDGGAWTHGRNFILKVDPSTLPAGAEFTTANPLLRRVTPGVPVRFDFGVRMPEPVRSEAHVAEVQLGEVLFAPDSAVVQPRYGAVLGEMAAQINAYNGGEVVIRGNGNPALGYQRAVAVREALMAVLPSDVAQRTSISVRGDLGDAATRSLTLQGEDTLLGTVLFDTDKAEIKPEFEPLLAQVAAAAAKTKGRLILTGHTDVRGSHPYNTELGLRRAQAVQRAIAAYLPRGMSEAVKVEHNEDPAAPAEHGR